MVPRSMIQLVLSCPHYAEEGKRRAKRWHHHHDRGAVCKHQSRRCSAAHQATKTRMSNWVLSPLLCRIISEDHLRPRVQLPAQDMPVNARGCFHEHGTNLSTQWQFLHKCAWQNSSLCWQVHSSKAGTPSPFFDGRRGEAAGQSKFTLLMLRWTSMCSSCHLCFRDISRQQTCHKVVYVLAQTRLGLG